MDICNNNTKMNITRKRKRQDLDHHRTKNRPTTLVSAMLVPALLEIPAPTAPDVEAEEELDPDTPEGKDTDEEVENPEGAAGPLSSEVCEAVVGLDPVAMGEDPGEVKVGSGVGEVERVPTVMVVMIPPSEFVGFALRIDGGMGMEFVASGSGVANDPVI